MSFEKFFSEANEAVKFALTQLSIKNESFSLTEPSKNEFGDLSCNVAFLLTKELQKSPKAIASMLVEQYHQSRNDESPDSQSYISSVVAHESGYINFQANLALIGKEVISHILKNDHLKLDIGKRKKVIIEHTSVNPNKGLHVGHLRNVAIGDTIYRILRDTNHDVAVLNYVDDSGLQIADILVGFLFLNFPLTPPDQNMKFDTYCGNEIYVKVNERYENDPSLLEKRKSLLQKLEEGDPKISSFASEITSKVLKDQLKTCWRMKARYDLLNFESHIIRSKLWEKTFERMRKENIIIKETEGENAGCWVFSDEEGTKIIVRSNGIATYIAKDIPYALLKVGTLQDQFKYHVFLKQWDNSTLWTSTTDHLNATNQPKFFPAKDSITVIDNRQTRLQKIIQEILNKFESNTNRYMHLSYGPVLLSSRTAKDLGIEADDRKSVQMSGRKGIFVDADFVLDTLYEKAKEETIKRNPEITGKDLETISGEIAISAMRYSLIKNDLDKELKFDMIDSLSLDGNSGPYLQYAYARCCRLIEKSNINSFSGDASHLSDPIEYRLMKHLSKYAIVIEDTIRNMEPKLITLYAYDLATMFNLFYEKLPILKEKDAKISQARITLVEAVRKILKVYISFVGITPLERM